MSTEARQVEDARTPDSLAVFPKARQHGRLWMSLSLLAALAVGLLMPLSIVAPKWFARRIRHHPVATSLALAVALTAAWQDAMSRTIGMQHNTLILGALGFVGLWAVGTALSLPLVATWEESDKRASYKAGCLVFCFGGGFSLLLLLIYEFALPAGTTLLRPRLPNVREIHAIFDILMAAVWFSGLPLSAIAPIQIFRGLASVGGGEVPSMMPLCSRCGYSLEGVQDIYRTKAQQVGVKELTEAVCSECGHPLAPSLESSARCGTAWTRGQDLSLRSWGRTLREVIRSPRTFFEELPMHSCRRAAVRFWTLSLLAGLTTTMLFFAINHMVCVWTRVAFPVPITGYQAAPTVNTPGPIWLPATLIAASLVMWGIVMAGTVVLCATAEYVYNRVGLLRERNMHPAGLLLACYLSGQVFAILALVTALFLAVRVVILAIPTDPAPIRFDTLILLRNNAGNIAVTASLVAGGLGGLLWFWPAAMRAGMAARYANQ